MLPRSERLTATQFDRAFRNPEVQIVRHPLVHLKFAPRADGDAAVHAAFVVPKKQGKASTYRNRVRRRLRERYRLHPLRNTAASPTRYDADPADLIAAVVDLRRRGAEILAIYHSHPKWQAVPSAVDLRENHYGSVPRIIVSLLAEPADVRVWRLDPESFEELAWVVVEPPGTALHDPHRAE